MSSKIWEINGSSLELDLGDADNMERYEKAFELMAEEEKNIPRDGKHSKWIRAYCKLFHDLFDRIFGEGTSGKIFCGVPASITACNEIYVSFLDFVGVQMKAGAQEMEELLSKYTPAGRNSEK